jgi:hypothetical protein
LTINISVSKKIPLDPGTNEPHDCPARREQYHVKETFVEQSKQQERRYLQCNKGRGQEIYFDANNKSQSGKWIPIDKDTGLPHQCQRAKIMQLREVLRMKIRNDIAW